jgi:hypothetical protein
MVVAVGVNVGKDETTLSGSQVKVVAPKPRMVTGVPEQTKVGLPKVVNVRLRDGATEIGVVREAVHPAGEVAMVVYVVFEVGETVITDPVKPTGIHE